MSTKTQLLGLPANSEDGLPARNLAYLLRDGSSPGVVWLGGFRSDMTSTKAAALDEACAADGRAMLRFDYTAHGESSGDFATATLSIWLDDAIKMIRRFGGPSPVLVGSSMGGWIALLATRRLLAEGRAPAGLVLIAPAVDFSERLMWNRFPQSIRDEIMNEGVWYRHSEYAPEPYPITRALIEDARQHLLMDTPLHVGVPLHILQGAQDPDVPLDYVNTFIAQLVRDDVTMTVIPDGNHRLSRPLDIAALVKITRAMAARGAPRNG
ncbi:MhpC Predicted hydrolases or acyltransferases (alpha/beta hydrolase superfamily) [Rhabdaerophilaceae bacterium]